MNPGFLLVLSLIIQLLSGSITKTVMPSFIASDIYEYIYIPLSTFISVFIPSYLYLKKNKKKYFTDFKENVKIDKFLLLAFIIGICTQFAAILANLPVNLLLSGLGIKYTPKIPTVSSPGSMIIAIISFALIPALCEEILFRGIILGHFRQYGDKSAVIISAILFSVMHLSLNNLFGTFVMGIIFGYLFVSSNRIIYPFIAHFTLNAIGIVISYANQNPIFGSIYEDYFFILIMVSIPLVIYLLKTFSDNINKFDYSDMDKYNYTTEFVFDIDENNSLKIYEHDIRENNIKLAFKELVTSPYFYIMLIIFVYIGGSFLW